MKIAPDELLKTKGQKSDPDESMKTKDLENSQTKTSKSLEMNRLEGLSVVSCPWSVVRGQLSVVSCQLSVVSRLRLWLVATNN